MGIKKLFVPLVLGSGLFAIPLLLFLLHAFDPWERAVYDMLCRHNIEADKTSENIALILIDTKSIEWGVDYYRRYEEITNTATGAEPAYGTDTRYLWPWKRQVYERFIDFLYRGGARVIVFDMVFDSPHPSGDRESDFTLGYATLLQNEEGLTNVIHTINFRDSENPPIDLLTDHEIVCLEAASLSVEVAGGATYPFHRSDDGFYYDPMLPYRDIVEEAVQASGGEKGILRLGAVKAQIDPDAVIRRARVLTRYNNWFFPSLGLAAAIAYWESEDGRNTVDLSVDDGGLTVRRRNAGDSKISLPLTRSGDILVQWQDSGRESYEGPGRFPTYPAYRILLSADEDPRFLQAMAEDPETFRVDPEAFKDRIVFIGASAPGLYDLKATPISENYPGVKVHAALAENILSGDPMQRASRAFRAAILIGLTLLIFLVTLYFKKTTGKFVAAAACTLLYLFAAGVLFSVTRLWIDTIAPVAGMLFAYMGGITYNYFTEGRHKREITRMFRHYVPPNVVDRLVTKPEALNTRGERVEITVLFSDIKGFTSISNTPEMRENPDRLTDHLNAYLTEMTGAIHEAGGTLDKYIGDAVVAFFGAPLPMQNHAREACRAALACQRCLRVFNTEAVEKGLPELKTRIGLYTGEAMVGNVGSKVRLSYTAIGSTVNFGARLEGVNKVYGTWILAGAPTVSKAGEEIAARFIDLVRVPGVVRSAPPLKVYEIMAEAGQKTDADQEKRSLFDKAMTEYQAARFEQARALFTRCEQEYDDPPSAVFARRCAALIDQPPADWDGVWKIESK